METWVFHKQACGGFKLLLSLFVLAACKPHIAGFLVFDRLLQCIHVFAFGKLCKKQRFILYGYKIIARIDSVCECVFVVLFQETV